MKKVAVFALCALMTACASSGGSSGGVVDKVMTDFGLRAKPEGYVEPSDKVFAKLNDVGKAEMRRMNAAQGHGEVKFQSDGSALGGQYYKEVKRYESFQPLDAERLSRSTQAQRGYVGYIDYKYRVYQSERTSSRTKATTLRATIPTDIEGHETYRYKFGPGGGWDGGRGELTHR